MHERDTVLENKLYKLVQVDIHGYLMMYMSNFENVKRLPDSVTLYYNIIIDPNTGLPYQVVQTTNNSKNISKTVFTGINTRPKAPETNSWYYTTYESEYTPMKKEKGRSAGKH